MEKFQTKKSLGQHFLNSEVVPKWLCDAGEVSAGDTIVEVGPGTGALTRELLARGAKIIALEADQRAIEVLQNEFVGEIESGQLELQHVDMREFRTEDLELKDSSFKVISNIPYYLTGMLFRVFLESKIQPSDLVFLVQKEVAKRATTKLERDEKESLLSLSIKAFGDPIYVRTVGKGHFTPAPKVDSAIIKVSNINRNRFAKISVDAFFKILHLGFGSKRKQLLGNLSKNYPREKLAEIFNNLNLATDVRGEDMSIDEWFFLVEELT